ncbi:MAG: hypothetical protein HY700_03495 [Gemmatimonadetes bacterium]|nr:hypothetical protein [Gemmatimonadota bacterium]
MAAATASLQTTGSPRTTHHAPWHLYCVVLGSISVIGGLIWDISWHRSIGRDTFWTPAHLAIYFGGILAGLSSGWLVLKTTFAGTSEECGASVPFWGFRGPLGAWVCIWGAFAMLTSAPFDNWWHDAYGLDVTILSPPHAVLGMGILGIQLGALLMTLAANNAGFRSQVSGVRGLFEKPWHLAPDTWHLQALYLLAAGVLLTMHAVMTMEYNFTNQMHSARFYQVAAVVFPAVLVAGARAAKVRFPATTIAAIYMGLMLVMIWLLQLFPAEPKLAPITHPLSRMVPPHFPLLLVVPALGIDLLMRWIGDRRDWRLSILLGAGFVILLLGSQWYFSEFLLSTLARNPVFAAGQWGYNEGPGDWYYRFWALDGFADGDYSRVLLARGLAVAVLIATASSRVGLWAGRWMARVRR